MTLEDLLRSPQFRQALFEVQTAESERLWAETQQDKFMLITGHCNANRGFCNECDYLIYCTNHNHLCLAENGACKIEARHFA